jgi:hypothetical protein
VHVFFAASRQTHSVCVCACVCSQSALQLAFAEIISMNFCTPTPTRAFVDVVCCGRRLISRRHHRRWTLRLPRGRCRCCQFFVVVVVVVVLCVLPPRSVVRDVRRQAGSNNLASARDVFCDNAPRSKIAERPRWSTTRAHRRFGSIEASRRNVSLHARYRRGRRR